MKQLTLAAATLCAVAGTLVTVPARAGTAVPGPSGLFCRLSSVYDPHPEASPNAKIGTIDAGPAQAAPGGTLICTVQVNSPTHHAADSAVAEFTSDAGGRIAGAWTVWYDHDPAYPEYLCTSYEEPNNNGWLYYTPGTGPGSPGRWHTDPSKAC